MSEPITNTTSALTKESTVLCLVAMQIAVTTMLGIVHLA